MKSLLWKTALLAVGTVALSGCGGGGGNTQTPAVSAPVSVGSNGSVSRTRSYGDLVFTLSVPKQVYAQGEAVQFNLTVQNNGKQEASSTALKGRIRDGVVVPSSSESITVDGTITDASGKVVVPNLGATFLPGAIDAPVMIKYPAGKTEGYVLSWNGYDGLPSAGAPGTYYVRAYINTLDLNGQPVAPYELGTDPIKIEVK